MVTSDVLFEETGAWGVITLARPQALNSLTQEMIAAIHAALEQWAGDDDIKAVMIKGAGDRAFCAGADIRKLHARTSEDPAETSAFFRIEYAVNSLIYHYPKPYVAFIDGVVMGGGVGLSVHGDFRVAGDDTLFSMPETAIGLFPDVGGGHFMPRMHDGLGLYYALTGARGNAADCMAAGVATHFTPTGKTDELERALLNAPLSDKAHADIETVLDVYAGDPGHAPINDLRADISRLFQGHESLSDLLGALQRDGGDFARETLETLTRMSPTSLLVTFEQMKRGRELDFDDNLKMEFRLARRLVGSLDFLEGVRAQIIDKDRNPKWSPGALSDVSDADIAAYFGPLAEGELELP